MTGNLDDLRREVIDNADYATAVDANELVAEFEAAVRADEQDKMCAIIAIAAQAATP